MLSSVEQAFVGRDEKRAPLKTPAWEARLPAAVREISPRFFPTSSRTHEFAIVNFHQSDRHQIKSSRQRKFVFLEQI